ncbi:MAG: Dolichyl-phosphate-mannose-protein mannosyltransferase [Blastocatellia bacterium]|nr:Dolichyl-phosphate-mannose-protein mannosyltransferase [Blastocatellia bacterium]
MSRASRKTSRRDDDDSRAMIDVAGAESFWRAWRWWLGPAALVLLLALLYQDPFIGDWDALDYTVNSVQGHPSTMALGRTLFIFLNHALYLVAHALFKLSPARAFLLFKYAVVAQAPLVVVACWQLARDLTRNVRAATIAALLVALSPAFVIYSGQVMTEIPSLLWLVSALIVYTRGARQRRMWLMLAGAMLLGSGVNLRETTTFYAPWLVIAPFVCGWKLGRRELLQVAFCCLVFLLFAFGGFAFWYVSDIGGYRAGWSGWRESMRQETARHPIAARNLLALFVYFFLVAPLVLIALPLAAWQEWRRRGLSLLLALALLGLCANLLLFFNYSTTINWRYLLTGLPALAPLVADYFVRSQTIKLGNERRAFWSAVAGVLLIALTLGLVLKPSRDKFVLKHGLTLAYLSRLELLPRDGVLLAGGQAVAVTYWRGLGQGRWEAIGTGGGWPGERLAPLLEDYLRAGRRVFLDTDPALWSPCGWQTEETRAIVSLTARFHFRRISETIYELRPNDDETARDAPDLQTLLPERRPAELKKCAGQQALN